MNFESTEPAGETRGNLGHFYLDVRSGACERACQERGALSGTLRAELSEEEVAGMPPPPLWPP